MDIGWRRIFPVPKRPIEAAMTIARNLLLFGLLLAFISWFDATGPHGWEDDFAAVISTLMVLYIIINVGMAVISFGAMPVNTVPDVPEEVPLPPLPPGGEIVVTDVSEEPGRRRERRLGDVPISKE